MTLIPETSAWISETSVWSFSSTVECFHGFPAPLGGKNTSSLL
jgi:hypothetical protein